MEMTKINELITSTLKKHDNDEERQRKEKQKAVELVRQNNIQNFLELEVLVDMVQETASRLQKGNEEIRKAIDTIPNYTAYEPAVVDLSTFNEWFKRAKNDLTSIELELTNYQIDTEKIKKMIRQELVDKGLL